MAEAVGCPCRPCDCIREDYFFPSQDAPGSQVSAEAPREWNMLKESRRRGCYL